MKKKLKLVTIRHGLTTFNATRTISGWVDVPLSDKGIKELQELKKTINYPITDRYYSSDLSRAIDTFDILFGESQSLDGVYEAFREINFGGFDEKPIEPNADIFYNHFLKDESRLNAESMSMFVDRVWTQIFELLDSLVENHLSSMTIVSHAGTTRMITFILRQMPLNEYRSIEVGNGRGYVFDIEYDPETQKVNLIKERKL